MSYLDLFVQSYKDFGSYVWNEITFQVYPWYVNYFYWLIALSLIVWALEVFFPWRKNQSAFRKDFWLDTFYMFFNFYIFKLIIFIAFSNLTSKFFLDVLGGEFKDFAIFNMSGYALWIQLLVFFVVTDFIQWFTHVQLHKYEFLWRFHKVHHSVEEMGFAAHLRYHWMENIFYTPMKYIVVMLFFGFEPASAFIVYYLSIAIGHLNHANIKLTYGPLKYIFNNPVMHLWHHSYNLPEDRRKGVNFGISLSVWDYIFGTSYVPEDSGTIKLGFPGMEKFPKDFVHQNLQGFSKED
jgi:sterol desaturase/sphingolipid hydroxylase (fatty acid hydroxylase superfamily)